MHASKNIWQLIQQAWSKTPDDAEHPSHVAAQHAMLSSMQPWHDTRSESTMKVQRVVHLLNCYKVFRWPLPNLGIFNSGLSVFHSINTLTTGMGKISWECLATTDTKIQQIKAWLFTARTNINNIYHHLQHLHKKREKSILCSVRYCGNWNILAEHVTVSSCFTWKTEAESKHDHSTFETTIAHKL